MFEQQLNDTPTAVKAAKETDSSESNLVFASSHNRGWQINLFMCYAAITAFTCWQLQYKCTENGYV